MNDNSYIWSATYNAQNRPTHFTRENADGTRTVITAAYDYLGRRAWKKVETIATDAETGEETATVTLHQRYIYRGYLQVAACDLARGGHPCLWLITWDPTQSTATRPLAIQKDGTWYCYGWDLTKNVCEVFGQAGYIRTTYSYAPYGSVTEEGDVTQPLQWSSEYADPELGLAYYNYRSYNSIDGRWVSRDKEGLDTNNNTYSFIDNIPTFLSDILGEKSNRHLDLSRCRKLAEIQLKKIGKNEKFASCDIKIECQYTENPPSYAYTQGLLVVIYIPKCLSDGDIGLINTINHELVHAYDNCRRGGIRDCESMWYGEVRGSYYGQCAQIINEKQRKQCAVRGAMRSVKSNIATMESQYSREMMKFWNCYPSDQEARKSALEAYNRMKIDSDNPFVI